MSHSQSNIVPEFNCQVRIITSGYIESDSVYFHISDHQGNIRQIWNATTAKTVQDNHYYPYGALLGESASTEYVKAVARGNRHPVSTNLYKYSAKEWQPAFGLNLYDFIARQYDPILCRFTSPDPLNGKYPQLSPYLYCAANPINYSDPTGLNPIYDLMGNYLGESEEGFTGEILIYDGDDKIDFSRYSAYELKEQFSVKRFGDLSKDLSPQIKLAIFNHVVAQFNGTSIFGERFDTSRMEGSEIQYYYEPPDEDGITHWATAFEKNGNTIYPPYIFWVNDFTNTYDATVENILSTVLVHEWYSHGIKHIGDDNHAEAYENVIKYRNLWEKTTYNYRFFVLDKLNDHGGIKPRLKINELLYINDPLKIQHIG